MKNPNYVIFFFELYLYVAIKEIMIKLRNLLIESADQVLATTIFLPMKKDKNGILQYSEPSSIKYTVTASPTPGGVGNTHDDYKSLSKLFVNDVSVAGFRSKKDATTGNFSGIFFADKETFKYLKDKVGKTATGVRDIYFSVGLEPSGFAVRYATYTVKTYEVVATAAPK